PVPKGVPVIDLALKQGVPGFLETLEVVLSELEVQDAIVASEQAPLSADMHAAFTELWNARTPVQEIPHEDFKTRMKDAKAVVRTGEFTPYSNVILVAGVVF
ncbi:MAG: D-ribose pyranase, partial [Deinococcota bacterium]